MFSRMIASVHSFSKKEKGLFFVSLSVFFVALIVLVLNIYFFGTKILPDTGGSFVEGVVGQPGSVNPVVVSSSGVDRDLSELLFADLLTMADSYERNDSGSEWVLKIKSGLFWSDGEVLDIDDVIFTINLIQNRELASPLAASWNGVEVFKEDGGELRIVLASPYRYFENTLRNLRPIPEHIFNSVPISTLRLSSFTIAPVSSGPYVFSSLKQGGDGSLISYKMKANANYAGGRPFIDVFEFRFFERFKDAIAAFNRGFIDGLAGFDFESANDIRLESALHRLDMPRYYAIFINQDSNKALKDLAVRKALAGGIDREKLIEVALGGEGKEILGPIPSYIEGYSSELYEDFKRSRASILKELEGSGWELSKESGIRVKDSEALSFDLIVPDIKFLRDSAFEIQKQLLEFGIEINPIILSPTVISSEIISSRDYELILFGNILRGNADLFSFWHSSQRFAPGLNLSLYENSLVDSALEISRSSFNQKAKTNSLEVVQKEILEDSAAVFLYSPSYLYAINPKVLGFSEENLTSGSDRFLNVKNWHLKKKRVLK